jgi:hypothetical protein
MRPLPLILAALILGSLTVLAPAQARHSAPATYSGPVASGGSVTFRIASGGKTITRIVLKSVATDCGTISSTTNGRIAIVNHTFSYSGGGLKFKGSFPAARKARGTLSYSTPFPSCTSSPARWTATKR